MFKKLTYLTCFVLVLIAASNAAADLVARWKLDDGSGTIATESVGGNDGTLIGDTAWADGVLDGALTFDGDGDYVDCGNDAIFNPPGSFSITFWVYINDWGDPWGRSMIGKAGDQDRGGWSVRRFSDDTIDFCGANLTGDGSGEGENHNMNSNTAPPLNEWFHIACVYDVNNMAYIYFNGELDRERPTTGAVATTDASVYLGTRGNTAGTGPDDWGASFFNGMLDDVRFYDHALEETDLGPIVEGQQEMPTPLASRPKPLDKVTGVPWDAVLTWKAGLFADTHDVYFGTVFDDVNEASRTDQRGVLVLQDHEGTTYDPPGLLEFGQKYFWRVDEFNDADPNSPWRGDVWSFTAIDYLLVDDFEDYNDTPPYTIWNAWADGVTDPNNGSQVGNDDEPYAEKTIVNSGDQSMPLFYDNSTAGLSEATKTLTSMRDWTTEDVKALALSFRGYWGVVGSFVEEPVGTYTMTATGADIWYAADEFHYAYKMLSGVGSIEAHVLSVENIDPNADVHGWAKAGVMIRETLEPGSKFAAAYITPSNGCRFQARALSDGDAEGDDIDVTTEQTEITAPHWVRITRDIAGNFNCYHSSDGTSWQLMAWSPVNIPMSTDVYIGLAVTAHDASAICEAQFSDVTSSDNVTGEWMNQDIGIQSNDAEPMYVAVANNTGTPAVVYHDDPNAAQTNTWTQWNVDLKDFEDQGVVLTDVNSITLGLGNRDNPQAGGKGKMYFDDIRLYRSRCVPDKSSEADLNGDCEVNFEDLEIMATDWLTAGDDIAADVNADSAVDLKDYGVLADQWLEQQLWPE